MFSPFNKQPKRLAKLADSENAMQLMSLIEDKEDGYGNVLESVTRTIEDEYYEFVESLNLTNEQFCRLDSLALGRICDYGRAMLVIGMLLQAQFGAARSNRPVDDVERVVNQIGQPSMDEKRLETILTDWSALDPEQQAELAKLVMDVVAKQETERLMAVSQGHNLFEPNQHPKPVEALPN